MTFIVNQSNLSLYTRFIKWKALCSILNGWSLEIEMEIAKVVCRSNEELYFNQIATKIILLRTETVMRDFVFTISFSGPS